MTNKRIAVLTLWRDSDEVISQALAQYEWLENETIPKGNRFIYAFLENDSKDHTAGILLNWLKDRKGFLISEKTGSPKWGSIQSTERTSWLARYRNICLGALDYWDFDYLLVADSDVQYRPDLIERMIQHLDQNPDWGMITPNTVQDVTDAIESTGLPSYYDSWALIDRNGVPGMTFASNPFLDPTDRKEWESNEPVEVNSAFGSIALIRGSLLEESVSWGGEKGCEHWDFCSDIRSLGYKIYVDPDLHAEIKHKETVTPNTQVVKFHKERLRQFTTHQCHNPSQDLEFSMTFGICTGYTNREYLIKCVESIRKQDLDDYEILVIGPEVPDDIFLELKGPDIQFLKFDETIKPLWITKKKNLLAQQASFERLCLLHDYLWLIPDWGKHLRQFEYKHPWSVLSFPQQRSDGGRFWYDWSGFEGPRELDNRKFYDYTDWSHNNDVYISGNIFCVNRYLLLDHPFDETLGHMQEEDLEWSRRISPFTHFKCAYDSLVCHQKEHRDQPFFTKVDTSDEK
jgi:GT2 family glycosyltransferase